MNSLFNSRRSATLILAAVSLSASGQTVMVAQAKPKMLIGRCPGATSMSPTKSGTSGWNGWGIDRHNSRSQTAAQAGLTVSDIPRLRLKWAFGFDGASIAFSQPAVVGGRLFVGSESGDVFALNPDSGCGEW